MATKACRVPQSEIYRRDPEVSMGTFCPGCNRRHGIVLSRIHFTRPRWQQALVRFYRCNNCDTRFRGPNWRGITSVVGVPLLILVASLAGAVFWATWVGN